MITKLAACFLVFLSAAWVDASLVFDGGTFTAVTRNEDVRPSNMQATFSITTPILNEDPFHFAHSAGIAPTTSSVTYDFTTGPGLPDDNDYQFDFVFAQTRGGTVPRQHDAAGTGSFRFTLTTPYQVLISGQQSLTGQQTVGLIVGLYQDVRGTEQPIFISEQISLSTPGQQLVIGERDGDFFNQLVHPLSYPPTFRLETGSYVFRYEASIATSSLFDGGASAAGNIRLGLRAVPEPASLRMLGLAIFAWGAARRANMISPPLPRLAPENKCN